MKIDFSTQKSRWCLLAALSAVFLACLLALYLIPASGSRQLTLKQAQQYSQRNSRPLFVHHTHTNRYTPLAAPIAPQPRYSDANASLLLLEEDGSAARVDPSAGDELVYLSPSQQAPETLTFLPIARMGCTYPLLLQTATDGTAVTELATPSVYFSLPAGNLQSFSAYDDDAPASATLSASDGPLLLDGLSAGEYLQTHPALPGLTVSPLRLGARTSGQTYTEFLLDATEQCGTPAGLVPPASLHRAPLTIGCYTGTVYQSFTLSANCLWLAPDAAQASARPTALTQDGYAQIDLTGLSSPTGCYAVRLPGATPRYLAFALAG